MTDDEVIVAAIQEAREFLLSMGHSAHRHEIMGLAEQIFSRLLLIENLALKRELERRREIDACERLLDAGPRGSSDET